MSDTNSGKFQYSRILQPEEKNHFKFKDIHAALAFYKLNRKEIKSISEIVHVDLDGSHKWTGKDVFACVILAIRNTLQQEPDERRAKIFQWYDIVGLPIEEAATIEGVSKRTAYRYLSKMREDFEFELKNFELI